MPLTVFGDAPTVSIRPTIEEMGKTSGRSGRTSGKKNKSLTSKKKKPTNNLSMKRRTKEQEKAHDLKIKVMLHRPAHSVVRCDIDDWTW